MPPLEDAQQRARAVDRVAHLLEVRLARRRGALGRRSCGEDGASSAGPPRFSSDTVVWAIMSAAAMRLSSAS